MGLNDNLADALSKINNYAKLAKSEVILKRSKFLKEVLAVMQKHSYIGNIEEIEDGKQGLLKVQLLGNINKCCVIKPRFSVSTQTIENYERRFLPAKNFGLIIVSSSQGLLTQQEVSEKNVGGVLVAFCY